MFIKFVHNLIADLKKAITNEYQNMRFLQDHNLYNKNYVVLSIPVYLSIDQKKVCIRNYISRMQSTPVKHVSNH